MGTPSEHRRKSLKWHSDANSYTPPSTLVERIDGMMGGYSIVPLSVIGSNPEPVKHGSVTDVKNGARADYTKYRKIHFSKMRCSRECPYCARSRATQVKAGEQ